VQDILRYHGLDWAGFAVTLLSLHLLGNQRRGGFLLGMVASVAWAGFSVLAESLPTLTANSVFFFMHLRAYVKWGRRPALTPADLAAPAPTQP
jgi:hypothetical protein